LLLARRLAVSKHARVPISCFICFFSAAARIFPSFTCGFRPASAVDCPRPAPACRACAISSLVLHGISFAFVILPLTLPSPPPPLPPQALPLFEPALPPSPFNPLQYPTCPPPHSSPPAAKPCPHPHVIRHCSSFHRIIVTAGPQLLSGASAIIKVMQCTGFCSGASPCCFAPCVSSLGCGCDSCVC
jgi:hypothetical protein